MAGRRWNFGVGVVARLQDPRQRTATAVALAMVVGGGLLAAIGLIAAILVGPGSNYTVRRSVQPASPVVILTPGVVGAVGPQLTVTARRADGGALFEGLAVASDISDLSRSAARLRVTGVRPLHRLTMTDLPGSTSLPGVQTSDIWRAISVGTGERSLTWRPNQAPESILVASPDGTSLPKLNLTISWHRSGWFPAAILALLIGLALLVAGLESLTGGHLMRRLGDGVLEPISRLPVPARRGRARGAPSDRVRFAGRSLSIALTLSLLSGCAAAGGLVGVHAPPAAPPVGPVLEPQQARAIAGRVISEANQADGARDTTAAAQAYDGLALQMIAAAYQIDSAQGVQVPTRPASDQRPAVLLTRGTAYPRFFFTVLAGTKSQPPVINLLTAKGPSSAYRISGAVSLLPAARLPDVADVADGSAVLQPGATGLVLRPQDVGPAYADLLNTGSTAPQAARFANDTFTQQVQQAAAAQRSEVARFGSYTQTHEVVPGTTMSIRTSNGGALVFTALRRTSTFTGRVGNVATLPSDVRVLTGEVQASMFTSTTAELLLFTVPPAGKGRVRLVAASDGLVAASAQ